MTESNSGRFKIKDIVFLALISAATICTCAVMPLVASLQPVVFGIAQAVTGLQISIFFSIGLSKVRKPGSLLLMAFFTAIIQLMMAPPMFFSSMFNGILLELLVWLIFKGYEKDCAVFFAAAMYNPLSLPFNYLFNRFVNGPDSALVKVADNAPWAAVGMTIAVIAISVIGTFLGMKIARELKKSGVLKK
ncbi:MAG: MptD family putative ECF transporter S component [Sphaerochaeta sp.]